jgi:GT2 family glycosyltransferase
VIYTEDLDFSWRVWLMGYKILLAPRSIVYHWTKTPEMRSHAGFSSYDFNFHLTKNSIRSFLKNNNSLELPIYLPLNLSFHIARFLLAMVKYNDCAAAIGILRGFLWNFINLRNSFIERNRVRRTSARIPSFFGPPLEGLSLCH